MDIQSFVNETLLQLSNGIISANEKLKTQHNLDRKPFTLAIGSQKHYEGGIEFDIAVSVRSEKKGKGGAKFNIHVVEADIGGEKGVATESISRIKFVVSTTYNFI